MTNVPLVFSSEGVSAVDDAQPRSPTWRGRFGRLGWHRRIEVGVESMSRAPFVLPKISAPFSRSMEIHDTTIGWCFVNRAMERQYGIDSMSETAENVAARFGISRADQDAFALRSQMRALA